MSISLRLVVGPVVLCDVELFAAATEDEAPPQLSGGSGTLAYPEIEDDLVFGFVRSKSRADRG